MYSANANSYSYTNSSWLFYSVWSLRWIMLPLRIRNRSLYNRHWRGWNSNILHYSTRMSKHLWRLYCKYCYANTYSYSYTNSNSNTYASRTDCTVEVY